MPPPSRLPKLVSAMVSKMCAGGLLLGRRRQRVGATVILAMRLPNCPCRSSRPVSTMLTASKSDVSSVI